MAGCGGRCRGRVFVWATDGAILREPIYVASEFGEYTLVRLLEALRQGSLRRDIVSIPNLVLATKDGSWRDSDGSLSRSISMRTTQDGISSTGSSMVPIRTSIGCPYRCRYCDFITASRWSRESRPQSACASLAKGRGRSFFNLIDDNIFLTQARIADLTYHS